MYTYVHTYEKASVMPQQTFERNRELCPSKSVPFVQSDLRKGSKKSWPLKRGPGQFVAGLPDGLFSNQKSKFGQILEAVEGKKLIYMLGPFGIFYRYLGYFMTIWYITYWFIWYIFSGFGIMYLENSGNLGLWHLFLEINRLVKRSATDGDDYKDLLYLWPDSLKYKVLH
jgi:hypothetical protein